MSESTGPPDERARLPRERIDAYVDPLKHYLHIEYEGGSTTGPLYLDE